jgi:hypothetical protein
VAAEHEHTTSEPVAGPDEAEADAETEEAFFPEA